MFQKLKDGANKLKAKIGGDDLDEKLVEVVSEQNWQASTQQLHQIANAAYNFQKWQKINEFIWDKLKKSKSWKKILKTFNLIEFLLKNGPPSILSNFKYDLYQLRTFESYSNYVDGLDKGEPIRERAKIVVNLLSNEELLEEERVKAKTIRQKMSNVVGGTTYGGSYNNNSSFNTGSSGNYGSNSYGSNNNKTDDKKKNDSYNYGNGLGYFGDYTYNKSTLDKYKDPKNDKPTTTSTTQSKKQQKKNTPTIEVEAKKPFEKIASKLSKPGEKKEIIAEEPPKTVNPPQNTQEVAPQNNIIEFDIFGGETTKAPTSAPFSFDTAPPVVSVQQPVKPVQQSLNNNVQPTAPQQSVQPPFNAYTQHQPPQTLYSPPQPTFPQSYPPQPFPQQTYPQTFQQQPQYPNQFLPNNQYPSNPQYPPNPQFPAYNQYTQPQPNYPAFQQQQQQQPFNAYNAPVYSAQVSQPAKANLNLGITLSPKKQQQFGDFSASNAGTAQNVSWLSNTEKGLIDFSDFGSEIKKQSKPASKQITNNIQIDTTWSW